MSHNYLNDEFKSFSEALMETQAGLADCLNRVPDDVKPWIHASLSAHVVTQKMLQAADRRQRPRRRQISSGL